jgi:hypothetical protein
VNSSLASGDNSKAVNADSASLENRYLDLADARFGDLRRSLTGVGWLLVKTF